MLSVKILVVLIVVGAAVRADEQLHDWLVRRRPMTLQDLNLLRAFASRVNDLSSRYERTSRSNKRGEQHPQL
ncbi:unnamed protein product [Toxocara canis]|uniref:RxLR effector protein n=1 Tax=Toxocara canis TaxID=6265 RepID=A0A183U8A5_TOXCA|nr:unnamed protein product [Toxocara canis]